jgi:outer membrane murein-binding lipoprotein Lpp
MKFTTTAAIAATLLVSGSCALVTDKASPVSSSIPSQTAQVEIIPNNTQNVIFNNALKDGVKQFFNIPVKCSPDR